MRRAFALRWFGIAPVALALVLALALGSRIAGAETVALDELLSGVLRLKTFINPDGVTVENLGREREGSAIVLDDSGLILTIGYLMVEAHAAEVETNDKRTIPASIVGYDQESGFGLLRAIAPLKVRPMAIGKSADLKVGDPVIAASFGGRDGAFPVRVVSKREFAGGWEYLLDEAIFTAPPHPAWSGAALIGRDGKLVGVGHLIVGDADGKGEPGNMFVPIDRLAPIFAELVANGQVSTPPKPWLGLSTVETRGRLVISNVTPGGPAEKAGLQTGDIIINVNGEVPKNLADFYRKVWAKGAAGVTVPLDVLQDSEKRRFDIKTINRIDRLKLKSTF